ncbi:MAG TPA: CPBP family intramembrane glutamic endopeptidase [Candidatus Saccharimonadaceae bacterium]|jgi:membrane protease YdiL (CAAX protease family)|nr:CPBP family intramembrane glutamic endopeptidase [Candidatus Saccharimonadaceae bacterium]
MDETAPAAGDPFSKVQLRWLFLAVGFGVIGYFTYAFAIRGELIREAHALNLTAYILALYVPIVTWMTVAASDAGIDLMRFLRPMASRFWWKAPPLALLVLAFSLMSSMVLIWAVSLVSPRFAHAVLTRGPNAVDTTSDSGFLVFAVFVLAAPVIEELLFRGVLLHVLAARWGAPRALIAVSLAFALLHPNPVATFAFSLVLGTLYLASRSLLAPILCHMTNNLVPTLMMLAVRGAKLSEASAARDAAMTLGAVGDVVLVPAIGSVLLGVAITLIIRRHWPRRDQRLPYFDDDAAPPGDAPTLEDPPSADSGSTS